MISLMYCLLNRNTIDVYPNRKKIKGKKKGKRARQEAREKRQERLTDWDMCEYAKKVRGLRQERLAVEF